MAAIVVPVRWYYEALAQRFSDYVLQQVLSNSSEWGVMTVARLRLATMIVVISRWSMNLDVISIIYDIRSTVMITDK